MNPDVPESLALLEEEGHLLLAEPKWREKMSDLLWDMLGGDEIPQEFEQELLDHIDEVLGVFVGGVVPERSHAWTKPVTASAALRDYCRELVDLYSGDQRTPEWFQRRRNMITASNAWKVLGSESARNSLIWEKIGEVRSYSGENVEGATHWGERYEPVAVSLYEEMVGSYVSLVGCIPHQDDNFIGASPDGIVVDAARGLEIKCVVSRELTGIPTKAYWVQMQWQAEVMGLDAIDFLECRFVEYDSREAAEADGALVLAEGKPAQGVMEQFHGEDGTYYVYAPLDLALNDYDAWATATIDANSHASWIQSRWWRLEQQSCVTVPRHRCWFKRVLPLVERLWREVEEGRSDGGEKYKPVKRKRTNTTCTDIVVETIPLYIPEDEE